PDPRPSRRRRLPPLAHRSPLVPGPSASAFARSRANDPPWRQAPGGDRLALQARTDGVRRAHRPDLDLPARKEPLVSNPSATPTADAPRLLISLATYNEAGNLRPLAEAIRQQAPDASILVIDDNSPDGTGRIADELRASLPEIHVIHRPGKLGLGTATIAAMRFPINHGSAYLLNMDADFSHDPESIPALPAA